MRFGRSKYGAKKTNGYHSKKEADRAAELHAMAKIGVITDLKEQVSFELVPKQDGERAVKYIADFQYTLPDGRVVTEDVKGFRTPVYVLKRKLLRYVHGITIREV
ncbi:MAG: hypothetical protein C5B44_05670 [Acidobacteria bacterium]|nr:MAG: hypothetical protein C5B44_05670 [Acidobacteriota bacterium]